MLLCAELFFAAATIFVKFANDIPPTEITFCRFLLGASFAFFMLKKTKSSFIPVKSTFLIWRGFLNTTAVILFFISVRHTTITNANMLNMTYPAFIILFAPLFGIHKLEKIQFLYLAASLLGIYLVIQPNFSHILWGDFVGLLSGIVSGAAIIALRRARETDNTILILFYVMGIGTIVNGIILIPSFVLPNKIELLYIVSSATLGVIGQFLITSGYKHIEAAKGGIVSTSRIFFAAIMGVLIFNERLNLSLFIGALLILWAIISLALREQKKKNI